MSSQKKKLQLLQEAKEKPRGCRSVASPYNTVLQNDYLTSYVNSVTITVQKIGNKLPLEAKKSHGVAAPWLFRYFLPLRSSQYLK